MKKQKSAALLFHSLIMGICKVSRVQFEDSDERINNEKVTTMRKVKRIAEEPIAAATPKHHTTARVENASIT